MTKIKVVPYDAQWKSEFNKAANFYREILKELPVEIEHVGSTSVENLWAKPILDIDIIVPNKEICLTTIEKLEEVGYKHVGDYGIKGREVLTYNDENEYINWMAHHLYVCIEGNENLVNHLKLRNHLRRNQEAVKKYGMLKRELAKKFPDDIDAYVEGKSELIVSFLEKEGMDSKVLDRITSINKKGR